MATVNLGRIKPQWQGTYASETSYVVDDMVLYNSSAYICTAASQGNAPTNTSYWDLMTQGFSGDAADMTSGTIPDARFPSALPAIDGSSLTGLSAGAVHQVVYSKTSTVTSLSSAGWADVPGASVTITPTSSSNNIIIISDCQIEGGGSNSQVTTGFRIYNSTSSTDTSGGSTFQETIDWAYLRKATVHIGKDSPASTSAQTYQLQYARYTDHGTMQAGGNGRGIVMLAIEVTP